MRIGRPLIESADITTEFFFKKSVLISGGKSACSRIRIRGFSRRISQTDSSPPWLKLGLMITVIVDLRTVNRIGAKAILKIDTLHWRDGRHGPRHAGGTENIIVIMHLQSRFDRFIVVSC